MPAARYTASPGARFTRFSNSDVTTPVSLGYSSASSTAVRSSASNRSARLTASRQAAATTATNRAARGSGMVRIAVTTSRSPSASGRACNAATSGSRPLAAPYAAVPGSACRDHITSNSSNSMVAGTGRNPHSASNGVSATITSGL